MYLAEVKPTVEITAIDSLAEAAEFHVLRMTEETCVHVVTLASTLRMLYCDS